MFRGKLLLLSGLMFLQLGCNGKVGICDGKYQIPVTWIDFTLQKEKYEKSHFLGKTHEAFEIADSTRGNIWLYSVIDKPWEQPRYLRGMPGDIIVPLTCCRDKYVIIRIDWNSHGCTYTPVFEKKKDSTCFLKIDAYRNRSANHDRGKSYEWFLIAEIPESDAVNPIGMGRDEIIAIFDKRGLFVKRPFDKRFRGYRWPDLNEHPFLTGAIEESYLNNTKGEK